MEQYFTLEITADSNFSVLPRVINIFARRRVAIKKLLAYENEHDFSKGVVIILLFTTSDRIEKISLQIDKLIEVENVRSHQGNHLYFELGNG